MSLKILQLSDLHICDPKVKEYLEPIVTEINANIKKYSNQELHFSFHNDSYLGFLQTAIEQLDPDVILITGDVTTFGDKASFAYASNFINGILKRGVGKPQREVSIIAGNHDVFAGLFKGFVERNDWIFFAAKQVSKLCLPGTFIKLKKLLATSMINADAQNPLNNFNDFLASNRYPTGEIEFTKKIEDASVWSIPYQSISLNPFLVNIGVVSFDQYKLFKNLINRKVIKPEDLVIALMHHNPISSPEALDSFFENSYDSTPNAAKLLLEMQNDGVDLVLYGHQHEYNCCEIDFHSCQKGHLNLIGSKSSLSDGNIGMNLITFENRYLGTLQPYTLITDKKNILNKGELRTDGDKIILTFENSTITDSVTIATQREIRSSVYKDNEARIWYDIFEGINKGNCKEVFLVGPRQVDIINKKIVKDSIIRFLGSSIWVNVLLSDPELYEIFDSLDASKIGAVNKIWSDNKEHSWENQAKEASNALDELQKLYSTLSAKEKSFLTVKLSHTLMPIGARAVNLTELNKGSFILLRLLPVGVFGDNERAVIRIDKRNNDSLFSYYCSYINSLWVKGKEHPLN